MYTWGRKQGCRISLDYTYKGMRVGFLENDLIRIGILLDKGGDIFEFTYKPRDIDFLWQSPIPMRPAFVATSALPEGAFHDYYHGGWQEVLPSAGWAAEPYLGTFQGLHGEVSLLPFEAQLLDDTPEKVSLKIWTKCYRSPLNLGRVLTLERGRACLFIHEKLENESSEEFAIMWGHHPAFGEPFLSDRCRVDTQAATVEVLEYHANGLWQPGDGYAFPFVKNRRTDQAQDIRRVLNRETQSVDVVFFKGLKEGWYGLTNTELGVGFGMSWDAALFKYLWMWQVYGGHNDYPWYGRTYNCALEPFTSYPPAGVMKALENGSARVMNPGEVLETDLTAVAYEGAGVSRIDREGNVVT